MFIHTFPLDRNFMIYCLHKMLLTNSSSPKIDVLCECWQQRRYQGLLGPFSIQMLFLLKYFCHIYDGPGGSCGQFDPVTLSDCAVPQKPKSDLVPRTSARCQTWTDCTRTRTRRDSDSFKTTNFIAQDGNFSHPNMQTINCTKNLSVFPRASLN